MRDVSRCGRIPEGGMEERLANKRPMSGPIRGFGELVIDEQVGGSGLMGGDGKVGLHLAG